MSIVSALKYQQGSIREIAMLPQQDILKLAQSGQLNVSLVPVILNEKAAMIKQAAQMQAAGQPKPPTVIEQDMATNAQSEVPQPAEVGIATAPIGNDKYQEQNFAGGGIVAFEDGGEVVRAQSGLYINPTFSEMIRKRETGGYRGDPNLAVSPKGAMGIMQVMPATARRPGFGVPDIFSIADQLGVPYEDKSEASAKKLLTIPEINQTFGDLYAGAMLKRFEGDPRLAAAAYNAGPGAVDRAGGVPNIPETQKYVAGISPARMEAARVSMQEARRGQVQDIRDAMTGPVTPGLGSTFDPYLDATQAVAPRDAAQDFSDYLTGRKPIAKPSGPTRADVESRQQEFADYLTGRRPITPASPEMAAIAKKQREAEKSAEAPVAAAAESPFADFRKYIEGQEKSLESQRAEDRAMSILAAGLGILGGTSPYAFTNIGQGALQGVSTYGKLSEQRAAKEKNLLAARLGLSEAELKDRYYTGALSAKEVSNRIAAGRLGATMQGNIIRARKQFMDEGGADKLAAEFEARYGKNWRKNPKLEGQYKLQMNELIREIAGGLGRGSIPDAEDIID